MTATILRYEFSRTIRPMLVILGVAVLVMLLADLLGLFVGLAGVVLAAMVVALMLPAIQFFLAIDFYRSSYGSGALLTHSLPVTGRRLFWTKLLHATLASAATGIVSLALFYGHLSLGLNMVDVEFEDISGSIQHVFAEVPGLLPIVIVSLVLALLMPIASMFSSVVIGSGGWARRLGFGGPVIVFVGYYLATQLLGAIAFFVPLVYDLVTAEIHMTSMWQHVTSDDPAMPLATILVQMVILVILLAWASRDMHSKVELR